MDQVIIILVVGILGTCCMDLLNMVFSKIGLISKIEIDMIGRMTGGWMRGRFFYKHPDEIEKVEHEVLLGYSTHLLIGITLAVPFIFSWDILFGQVPNFGVAVLYGTLTTIVSWFYTYPSIGFGILGLKSSEGLKATYSSLANHLFYGLGLGIGLLFI